MLTTTIEVQIFDDPKYCDMCHDENDLRPCPHLISEELVCTAFTVNECFIKLEFDYDEVAHKKHPLCIEAWNKQKLIDKVSQLHNQKDDDSEIKGAETPNGELDLKNELGEFMKRTLSPPQKPFHVLMAERYLDVEYQLMFVDEKGFPKSHLIMDVIKIEDRDIFKGVKQDMSLYGIGVKEVEKLKEIGQECGFECEKFGLPKNSAPDKCDECIHTPPF